MSQSLQIPVAVVGVGALLPGSTDAGRFWRSVLEGHDLITDVPPTHWIVDDYYDPEPSTPDKTYGRTGAFLPPVEFDPVAFGLPPNTLEATDTSQLLALKVAEDVLADAGGLAAVDRDRVSVIVGSGAMELLTTMNARLQRPVWLKALRESGVAEPEAQAICDRIADHYVPWQESTFPGVLSNVVAGRIANKFDLHGTNFTTDAACASSLAALSGAVSELQLGRSDLVLSGGVDTVNDILMYMCFSKTPALSPTGDCRPFSAAADGTVLGEGLVMFALKRLADAERAGDRVYAVIRGLGASSDGRGTAVYAPLPDGQARALRRAYDAAGYRPDTVELVEAHGTGTKAGDAAEFTALRALFAEAGDPGRRWCALGSVKSQIGHTKCAAGAAGLLKTVLALHQKVLPPTIKVERPNPQLGIEDSPLYLNTRARPWVRGPEHPRRAAVSSFGFGGTNFHVTLEEYVPADGRPTDRVRALPAELVLLSAPAPAALVARARALDVDRELADIARETQQAFERSAPSRLAVTATDAADLVSKLGRATALIEQTPEAPFTTPAGVHYGTPGAEPGEIAFLFPGQGSQYVGMGADLAMHLPEAMAAWDRAAAIDLGDRPLHEVVFPIPVFDDADRATDESRLTATEWAQPALAVSALALLDVLRELEIRPGCAAGHSFGELVALHAAGAFDEETLLRMARRRGELMRAAAEVPGAMLAISATRGHVEAMVASCSEDQLWIANHNAPEQVVVAGSTEAISSLERRLADAQVAAHRLNAATGFHSPLVAPARDPLLRFLESVDVRAPEFDVYGNADATCYPADPSQIRHRVADHLASEVRFAEQIEAMYQRGVRTFIEVGAGSAVTGLTNQVLGDREHLAVSLDRKGRNGVVSLCDALGRLAVGGVPMDLGALWNGYDPATRRPMVNPSPATVAIGGPNYNRPYPPPGGVQELPPPNPTPAVVAPAAPPSVDRVNAYEEAARRTADAHATYVRQMADTQLAFLKTTETLLANLGSPVPGRELVAPAPGPPPEPGPVLTPEVMPEPPEVSAVPTVDLEQTLLSVVADKTGYPVDILNPGMELEADLGIDSIKRVEILSALRERTPELPDVPAAELGTLRSLGEIITRLTGVTAAPEKPVTGEPVPLVRLAVRAVPAPPSGLAMAGLGDGPLAVTDDGGGVAELVVGKLREHGLAATVVAEIPDDARGVIFLGGLRDVTSVPEALAVNRAAFRAASAVARRFAEDGGVFVTVQDTGGDFGLAGGEPARAWLGGVAALARTAAREWPAAAVKAIDCERAGRDRAAIAEDVVHELLTGGGTLEAGLRADRTRVTVHPVENPCDARKMTVIGPESVIVATGGARGVTAAAILALAERYQPRIVLIGRTQGSSPEVRQTLDALERAGSKVRYVCVDVRDAPALTAALDEVRQTWGPITGIVHGAGVLADSRIADKTEQQFEQVFDTKVAGLRALLAATADDPLDVLCLFSSVVARYGNPGQSDYGMANEILNLVACAEAARRPDCLVRAIGWGPWQGGMVTPGLAEHFRRKGVPLIPLAEGAKAFVTELSGSPGQGQVLVAPRDSAGSVDGSTRTSVARAEVRLSSRSHPQLADHAIAGTPVVPVAMVLEWFIAVAREAGSPSDAMTLLGVNVLRKITLDDFVRNGTCLTVRCTVDDGGGRRLELLDANSTPHYQAGIEPGGAPRGHTGDWDTPADLIALERPEIYDGHVLFHGPAFQTIRAVEGVSSSGAVATVGGVGELGWAGARWWTDPAAADGGLQLALLWAEHVLGGAALPMSVGEYRVHREGPANGPLRCVVRASHVQPTHAECDIALLDRDGSPRAELLSVDLVLRPAS